MKLQALKDLILDKVFEDMKETIINMGGAATASVSSEDTCIDLTLTVGGCAKATVTHYGNQKKASKNLEAWCEGILRELSWDEAKLEVDADNAPTFEEEYARHGESLFSPELQWHRIR